VPAQTSPTANVIFLFGMAAVVGGGILVPSVASTLVFLLVSLAFLFVLVVVD